MCDTTMLDATYGRVLSPAHHIGWCVEGEGSEMFVEIEYFKTFADVALLYGPGGGPVLGIFTKAEYGKKYKAKAAALADYIARSNGGLRIKHVGNAPRGRSNRCWKAHRRTQWH